MTQPAARTPLTLVQLHAIAADTDRLAELIDTPFAKWAHGCHHISLRLLRTGVFGPGRIARGFAPGVGSQHSWIVLGDDVYDPLAACVDPTIWSYVDHLPGIRVGPAIAMQLRPHGSGSIWDAGKPVSRGGPPVELTPSFKMSGPARRFVEMISPLDRSGWNILFSLPMGGWPSGEIIAAADDTPDLTALVPVDILGMVTDRNPGNLYR